MDRPAALVEFNFEMSSPPLLAALGLGLCLPACCVAPPSDGAWLAVGWRSPTQAFETFQTAIRADSPELEYRCFSNGFRERNNISKIVWREGRERLRAENPWLRKGIADARFVVAPLVQGALASAVVASHGHQIEIHFVREDFAELYEGETLVGDELVDFEQLTHTQPGSDDRVWFQASVALPSGDSTGSAVTEMRIGREWKIDSFTELESPRKDDRSRAEALEREAQID